MIKLENTEVHGIARAVYSARNAMNSWDKSDSDFVTDTLGENDLRLARNLVKAGSDHSKFMRMINVTVDVTAPTYLAAEMDTYKVGTVRNSCSFMHKGVSSPFSITDFSIHDDRVYEVLSPLPKKKYELKYPYETEEKRVYTCANGRQYEVYRNGRVFTCDFTATDKTGRTRAFKGAECKPSRTSSGYYELNLGGRNGEKWVLHRLVATVWLDNPLDLSTVNHIDGDKGNNSVENLEWCSLADNITAAFDTGLYDNLKSLRSKYLRWKNGISVLPVHIRSQLLHDARTNGLTGAQAAKKYGITTRQANNLIFGHHSEYEELFQLCHTYEGVIDALNRLRDIYLETKDEEVFQQIRCLLPSGYNQRYTWQANYAVLRNIYHSRKNHRLTEWHTFCHWIESLPYSELITL